MNQAIRSFTANPLTVLSSPLPYRFGQKASVVKFRQLTTQYRRPENSSSMESKEKKDPNNTQEKSGLVDYVSIYDFIYFITLSTLISGVC